MATTNTSDLQPFLSEKPIVLIVEDRITKEYLINAWGPDEQFFNILTAGGSHTVKGVVEDLRNHGSKTVFGLVDRDFGESNVARWSMPNDSTVIFRPSFHEIENVLLDWPALAGCDLNRHRRKNPRTAQEIERTAISEAQKQPWWLACRNCLAQRKERIGANFPKTPPLLKMTDFQPAFDHIATSPWQRDLLARAADVLDTTLLETDLKQAHLRYSQDLSDGQWVKTYSGKKIFRVLLSRIYDVPSTPASEPDVDLAKSVGYWHFDNGTVPKEIDQIKSVLRRRVGV